MISRKIIMKNTVIYNRPAHHSSPTSIGEEVFMEFVFNEPKDDRPLGGAVYIEYAKNHNWSDEEIKRLVKAKTNTEQTKLFHYMAYTKAGLTPPEGINSDPSAKSFSSLMKSNKTPEITSNKVATGFRALLKPSSSEVSTLFISNIPPDYNETDIKNEIQTLGFHTTRVTLIRRDEVFQCSARVSFFDSESANACLDKLQRNNKWSHCVVNAQMSRPRE
jgi:hypothetical protein